MMFDTCLCGTKLTKTGTTWLSCPRYDNHNSLHHEIRFDDINKQFKIYRVYYNDFRAIYYPNNKMRIIHKTLDNLDVEFNYYIWHNDLINQCKMLLSFS